MPTNKTAILIFSRFAEEEAKDKKYGQLLGKRKGVAVAATLIKHTLKEASHTTLPVYKFFSNKQQGDSFGEKLSSSIETVYSYGFSSVIVIGTDCPSINSEVIISASEKLDKQDVVLGPSKDGGVYLIGIRREAFCRKRFLSVPWLSANVFNCLVEYAKQPGLTISTEPLQHDLDSYSELIQWTKENIHHTFARFFDLLIDSFIPKKTFSILSEYLPTSYLSKDCLRGPPSFFAL